MLKTKGDTMPTQLLPPQPVFDMAVVKPQAPGNPASTNPG